MDPDANLTELRETAARILADAGSTTHYQPYTDSERLAELVQALDTWIVSGGFLPADWKRS